MAYKFIYIKIRIVEDYLLHRSSVTTGVPSASLGVARGSTVVGNVGISGAFSGFSHSSNFIPIKHFSIPPVFKSFHILINLCQLCHLRFGIVVSTSECDPRGHGFDSRLCPRNFSRSIGSGTVSTQPREANWVAA